MATNAQKTVDWAEDGEPDLATAIPAPQVSKDKAGTLQGSLEGAAPWLWHLLGLPLTLAPASLIGLGLGAVLLWLGQPGREPIGFLTKP